MTLGYWVASAALVSLLLFVAGASYYGWGLQSDTQALAAARSVRAGSLHTRHHYGGGPGFGK